MKSLSPLSIGATALEIQAILQSSNGSNLDISLNFFGVVGDGVTDDTVALQAALNAGNLDFGNKTYKLSAPLVLPKIGDTTLPRKLTGSGASIVTSSQYFLTSDVGYTPTGNISNVTVEGLLITSISTVTNVTGYGLISLIDAPTVSNILIRDNIFSAKTTNTNGITLGVGGYIDHLSNTSHIRIEGNYFDCGRAAIEVLNHTNAKVLAGMQDIIICNNKIINSGQANSKDAGTAGLGISISGAFTDIRLIGNNISNCTYAGIEIVSNKVSAGISDISTTIQDNTLTANYLGLTVSIGGTPLSTDYLSNISIIGNCFKSCIVRDVIDGITQSIISNNRFLADVRSNGASNNHEAPTEIRKVTRTEIVNNVFYTDTGDSTTASYNSSPRFTYCDNCNISNNIFTNISGDSGVQLGHVDTASITFTNNILNDNLFYLRAGASTGIFLVGTNSNNNYGSRNVVYCANTALIALNYHGNGGTQLGNDLSVSTFDGTNWVKPLEKIIVTPGNINTFAPIAGTDAKALTHRRTLIPVNSLLITAVAFDAQSGQHFAHFKLEYYGRFNNVPLGGVIDLIFGSYTSSTALPQLSFSGATTPTITANAADANGHPNWTLALPTNSDMSFTLTVTTDPDGASAYTVGVL